MQKDEQAPRKVSYPRGSTGLEDEKQARNRDLDPQLVWHGKDQQDWSDLVVHVPPLYIQLQLPVVHHQPGCERWQHRPHNPGSGAGQSYSGYLAGRDSFLFDLFAGSADCGTVINPMSVEGQLEGSIHMGLGYALSEQLIIEEGKTLNTTFLDYKIPNAMDMPPGESKCIDTYEPEGPMGAKEAGEGLVSPTAPAIGDAVFHATGFRCRDLPITPEKVLEGLGKL
jgi:hypothetical protein